MCDSSNKEYISGNSLAWEHLGEWFVGESCSTRAMNLLSKLSCQPYLGFHASTSGDLCLNLSHRQGDWWRDRSQTCCVEFGQGTPSCLQATKWPCSTGGLFHPKYVVRQSHASAGKTVEPYLPEPCWRRCRIWQRGRSSNGSCTHRLWLCRGIMQYLFGEKVHLFWCLIKGGKCDPTGSRWQP